jgi:5-methylcytosine-specific restriction endonuclease McrA
MDQLELRERNARYAREKRKAEKLRIIAEGNAGDYKICTKCLTRKLPSEFSTRKNGQTDKLNKICDSCLTAVYLSPSRLSNGFDTIFWRKRAYTCNNSFRDLTARRLGKPVKYVRLKDLDYICKPQDLAQIFDSREGKCFFCKVELCPTNTSVDHAEAKSRGGLHHPSNFRIVCRDCNHLKHTRSEDEFKDFIKEYVLRFK